MTGPQVKSGMSDARDCCSTLGTAGFHRLWRSGLNLSGWERHSCNGRTVVCACNTCSCRVGVAASVAGRLWTAVDACGGVWNAVDCTGSSTRGTAQATCRSDFGSEV